MSYQNAAPSLDQYPGYFPAAKPPFWTRAKVGAACGVLGLIVGGAAGMSGDSAEPAHRATAADVNQAVDEATADLEQQLADSQAALQDQAEQAEAEQKEALAAAERQARLAQRKAVEKAVAAEKSREAASQTAPDVNSFASSPRKLDRRFGTCGEANDAGYGPYLRGIDPEYDWYDDRDNDGLVCES
jgi:uncharacterized membrane protein YccC